ncbi:hypothetical protein [Actinophytocola sp.]|uniref:hypothetical protein n=1 Tax=Actinophytocola sp. TaxID=1872138 RepID=UPI00345C3154
MRYLFPTRSTDGSQVCMPSKPPARPEKIGVAFEPSGPRNGPASERDSPSRMSSPGGLATPSWLHHHIR